MCGRFTVTTKDTKKIADRFQVELEKALERGGGGAPAAKESAKDGAEAENGKKAKAKSPPGMGRFNVAPTQEILVVRASPDPDEAAAGEREALELRVVPIDTILARFPRVVRALAQEQGKNVRLVLEGRDVQVDKSTVELLVDPLMHMVRNAVDHGIETPEERTRAGKPAQATVTMAAMQRGGEILPLESRRAQIHHRAPRFG